MKNNKEIEQAFLGLLISEPNLLQEVIGKIKKQYFDDKDNSIIFEEVVKLFEETKNLDEKILINSLNITHPNNKRNYWTVLVTNLIINAGVKENFKGYIKLLIDNNKIVVLKESLELSLKNLKNNPKEIKDILRKMEDDIFDINTSDVYQEFPNIKEIIAEYEIKMKKIIEGDYKEGLKTKISFFDKITGGFKNGELTIIAARPSMGKTTFALQLINNVSQNHNVAFFSLEMPSNQIIQRIIASETSIDQQEFINLNNMPQNKIEIIKKSLKVIENKKIWIDDTPGLNVEQILWKVRKLNSQIKLEIVFVDYLQLIEGIKGIESRQQAISHISRSLKLISRELNIPVVALSQLSRKVESREDKRPLLSDLRESGSIEQDADVVMFLYRSGYYEKEKRDNVVQDLEVIVSKNRNGKTTSVTLDMHMQSGRVTQQNKNNFNV